MKCRVCGYEYKGLFCPACDAKSALEGPQVEREDALGGYDFDVERGLYVEDVFLIAKRGVVVTGTVIRMTFSIGQKVFWINEGKRNESVIAGIECHRKMIDEAKDGDTVGILLRGIANQDISQGCVLRIAL